MCESIHHHLEVELRGLPFLTFLWLKCKVLFVHLWATILGSNAYTNLMDVAVLSFGKVKFFRSGLVGHIHVQGK